MTLNRPKAISFSSLALLAACASAPVRPQLDPRDQALSELQAQLKAQSALVAEQQRRIDQLEMKLVGLSTRIGDNEKKAAPPPAPLAEPETHEVAGVEKPADGPTGNPVIEFDGARQKPARAAKPGKDDPRNKLQTVKLQPAKGRRLRRNPVDRAPRLDTGTDLKEPEDHELRELAGAPGTAASDQSSDAAFAHAVQRLNDGDKAGAQAELLKFARRHPQHAAADNAIFLAGLAQSQSGDCDGALSLFGRVQVEYPAGDAVPAARLEAARCLLKTGRAVEAKESLAALEKDFPDVPEASQARALLNGL